MDVWSNGTRGQSTFHLQWKNLPLSSGSCFSGPKLMWRRFATLGPASGQLCSGWLCPRLVNTETQAPYMQFNRFDGLGRNVWHVFLDTSWFLLHTPVFFCRGFQQFTVGKPFRWFLLRVWNWIITYNLASYRFLHTNTRTEIYPNYCTDSRELKRTLPILLLWAFPKVYWHRAVWQRSFFVRSFVRSFVHSFIRSFVRSFIRSFIHVMSCHVMSCHVIHSFIHFIYLFLHSFIHLFIHLFIHSFIDSVCVFPRLVVW